MVPFNQPPSSVSAPPPSEAAILSRRKWRWLKIAGVVSTLGCTLVVAASLLIRPRCGRGRPHVQAVSDARQIGLALFEFEAEYGSLPNASTVHKVRAETGSALSMGIMSSNDCFRQLLGAGVCSQERMFYVRMPGTITPDEVVSPGEALKKGECGFTYLLGGSMYSSPVRPLVVAPMVPGTARFDRKLFQGKAVILLSDNSAVSVDIDPHGHAIYQGRNLMDPRHPVWGGHAPTIAWPE